MHVLAGDVGGTKTLLQITAFNEGQAAGRVVAEQRFDSRVYSDLETMAQEFLGKHGDNGIEHACFGVAGPINDVGTHQQARLTNLPWVLDSAAVAQSLGLRQVRLINDFQAVGYGIDGLGGSDLEVLQSAPIRPGGSRLAVGAGTGLGVALLHYRGDHYEVHPTEAGHMDFAPTDPEQDALLQWLRHRYGRVSYERVVSGMGIEDVFRFFLELEGKREDPLLSEPDIAAAISAAALANSHPLAVRTLHVFVEAYGSVAGNLALAALAGGGIYLAGGIAPQILPLMRDGRFMAAFNRKGRMSALTRAMPVYIVINPKVGLIGAALAARRLRKEIL